MTGSLASYMQTPRLPPTKFVSKKSKLGKSMKKQSVTAGNSPIPIKNLNISARKIKIIK